MFSSVNGDFYRIQLTLVLPISLSRGLAISPYSVIGSGGHSKSSNIVRMSTLPASIKQIGPKTTEKKWRHHYHSDSLTNHNVRKFSARHSFVFVSIRIVQEVLRILETCSLIP